MGNLMTCREYAEYKRIPYKTVLRLAKIKDFPSLKVGEKKIYVLPRKADEWFERRAEKPI